MSTASPSFAIDLVHDLDSLSDLSKLLTSQPNASFALGSAFAAFAGKPIQEASGTSPVAFSINAPATWKTPGGISFSLTPSAKCTIAVAAQSSAFPVALNVDSPDTTKISAGPLKDHVYINIEIDFDIKGSVSGSGTFSGIGIAGKASGSETSSFSFCHPVLATLESTAALKLAFSSLILPLAPQAATRMPVGSIAKVNFDGAFDCKLSFTYGLAHHSVSAPGIALVRQSLGVAWQKLPPPSLSIAACASASVSYTHADHFGLILSKTDDASATAYLVRSATSEIGASLGVNLKITASAVATKEVATKVDPAALAQTAQQVTGSPSMASSVAKNIDPASLESKLTAQVTTWLSDPKVQTGLSVSLARKKGRVALFAFKMDLTSPQLAEQSWSALLSGSVTDALHIGGFTLLPGSGIGDTLKRSCTIQFQFFNLFKWTGTDDYFANAYTELAADGTIRVLNDIGEEQQTETKQALQKMRIHFVASATEDTKLDFNNAEVELRIELSETGDPKDAQVLTRVMGMLPANSDILAAQQAMGAYAAAHPAGNLTLALVFKPSAYSRLSCSPYNGSHPPALPQAQDQNNWQAFQSAAGSLLPQLSFVPHVDFAFWTAFNNWSNYNSAEGVPNRRHPGSPNAMPPSAFGNLQSSQRQVILFLLASAAFMNLCDDLGTLAAITAQDASLGKWDDLLKLLASLTKKDVFIDYAKPSAGALLRLCGSAGAAPSAGTAAPADAKSFTCTVTLS